MILFESMKSLVLSLSFVILLSFAACVTPGKTSVPGENSNPPFHAPYTASIPALSPPLSDTTAEKTGLSIKTVPSGSAVYINGNFAGITPLTLEPETGKYRITVQKGGYYNETYWLNFTKGEKREIDFVLKKITGFLYLETVPSRTKVQGNGISLHRGVNELPTGIYRIKADLFGYTPYETIVRVRKKQTTKLSIHLTPAVFAFTRFSVSKNIFNPENPSGLGQDTISFCVSTYGTGSLTIRSPSGKTVLSRIFPSFNRKNQYFVWNGTDRYGNILENGTYTVVLTGKNRGGTQRDTKRTYITIDHSLVIKGRNIFSGASGTLYSPTPEILPEKNIQLSFSGIGHINGTDYLFPLSVSARIGFADNLETDISGGITVTSPEDTAYFFSLAVKHKFLKTKGTIPFSMAVLAKGTYLFDTYADTMTNFTGVSVSLPAEIMFGSFSFIFTPDIILAPFQISSAGTAPPLDFSLWGYGRGGIIFDAGPFWTAVSAAVRTDSFTKGVSIRYPLETGWEINWLLPGTGVFISGYITSEVYSNGGYSLSAGGGVGIIY